MTVFFLQTSAFDLLKGKEPDYHNSPTGLVQIKLKSPREEKSSGKKSLYTLMHLKS